MAARPSQKVLYKDENTGAIDVADRSTQSRHRLRRALGGAPGSVGKQRVDRPRRRPLQIDRRRHHLAVRSRNGIPSGADGFIQANLAIAPSDPSRLYASIATAGGNGIYRSDDAGEHWTRVTTDQRPAGRIGGGDLAVPAVDPEESRHRLRRQHRHLEIRPTAARPGPASAARPAATITSASGSIRINPDIILLVSDQGAIITVNGGETWSSWYNQPTAQIYHVNADNEFPYRVCGGQQESGSACVASRGNDGQITFRDWHPSASRSTATPSPDPLDPDIVYGGKVTRFDRRTGQVANVAPKPIRGPDYRTLRTAPVVFSQADPHVLFFAANTSFEDRRWRPQLEADQPRPHAQDLGDPRQRRQVSRAAHRRSPRSTA